MVGRKGIMVGYIKTGKGRVGHDMKKRAGQGRKINVGII